MAITLAMATLPEPELAEVEPVESNISSRAKTICSTSSLEEMICYYVDHLYCQAPGPVQGPGSGPFHGLGQDLNS